MAFDIGGAEGFIKAHPIESAVGGLAIVLVVWYLVASGSSSAPVAATGSTDDTATEAAAAIQAAQVTANSQTAAATIQAGVTDNQTAAAQTVALATLQGQNDANAAAATASIADAYYGAATDISANNSATAIAGISAQASEQQNQDTLLTSEFSNLASVLTSYGQNVQALGSLVNPTSLAPTVMGITALGEGSSIEQQTSAGVAGSGASVQGSTTTSSVSAGTGLSTLQNIVAAAQSQGNVGMNTLQNFTAALQSLFTFSGQQTAPATPSVNIPSVISSNNALLTQGTPPSVLSGSLSAFE